MTMKPKLCGGCGGKTFTAFTGETFIIGSDKKVHGLSGNRCDSCGEVYFDHKSQARYVEASDAWILARREEEKRCLFVCVKNLA
ncbi:hypothetical protein [Neopusillimonas aromaticivorans]|uniref:hypothetical protein n=1 Tax=Neopusillimonas aromaticivorans TaxID=2979868 RepID=UPI00259792E2|nr:hypothetical protein [Neopusillimonas aromaticivorans]WJJ93296.1 hypothetical protein N7E01_15035 [Neopusillimonas aromaticivorans]